ncbi:hypothetical protein [Polaribacter sp. L3A8]|uniref:hypothetical protein n=1 Tax=Polaribacter sp. L3A8 TaxID=2686361 RepID=UPI00131BEBF1|nr:hypothetical protein [Polaribacter sp. L3A8]
MKLIQKKLFLKKEITLEEDRIKLKNKNLTSSEEIIINLEELDISRLIYKKTTDNLMLIITLFFGVFFLINLFNPANYEQNDNGLFGVLIFLFGASLISGLITFLKSKNVIIIPTINNGYIELFRTKPDEKNVKNFINELSEKVNLTLKNKYGKIDLDMPIEPQLMNINWLKERKVISDLEFEQLKSELIKAKKNKNKIGFKE